jgi:hypothetical protein
MTIGPVVGFGLIILGTALWAGRAAGIFLLGMTIGGFVGGGKLVVLAGAVAGAPVSMLPLAVMVVYGDVTTALVITANMHYLYRIPAIGRRLAAAREAGFRVLKVHKWMRRTAELGLVIFVAMPFQGSGAVLGVILGRILGLSRLAIVSMTLLGSGIGASFVVLAGKLGQDEIAKLADNPVLGFGTVIVTLAATFCFGKWFLGQNRNEAP